MPICLRHVFGLKGDTANNIHCLDDTNVIFPAGYNIVIYNTEHKTQKFLPLGSPDYVSSCDISALALSPPRANGKSRYLAVAERGEAGKADVTVYDLQTFRKKNKAVIQSSEVAAREYVSMAFSADGKYLLTQGGAPDWTLVNWQWEKGRPVQSARVSTQAGAPINQVSFCPVDPSVVCVTGQGVLRFLHIENSEFKVINVNLGRREAQNYLCHCWIESRAIVGTDTGDLLLFEDGDFKGVLESSPSDGKGIYCITSFSKGFVCGCDDGVIYIFERDEKVYYQCTKSFQIDSNYVKVQCITIAPSEEYIVCALENNQAFVLGLASSEIVRTEDLAFEPLAMPVHYRAITGMDVCVRKPYVVTCGADRSVRVWNYTNKTLVAQEFFTETPYSVSIHPTGLQLIVGFADKLRMLSILVDTFQCIKEIPIKACRECKFSHGGHMFAAADASAIQLYNTYTCELIGTFKLHKSRVQSIDWNLDDLSIVSCATDGFVYHWRVASPHQEFTIIQSMRVAKCQFNSAICYQEEKSARLIAVGGDRSLRLSEDGQIQASQEHNVVLTQLCIWRPAASLAATTALATAGGAGGYSGAGYGLNSQLGARLRNPILFAGTEAGCLRCFPLPLTDQCYDVQCHSAAITRVSVSPDGTHLFTAGADGCLCIFELDPFPLRENVQPSAVLAPPGMTNTQGSGAPGAGSAPGQPGVATTLRRRIEQQHQLTWADEVLVSRADLEERAKRLADLKKKAERAQLENKLEIESKEDMYRERRRELEEKFRSELQLAKKRLKELELEKEEIHNSFANKQQQQKKQHADKMEAQRIECERHIQAEQARCVALQEKLKKEKEERARVIEQVKRRMQEELQKLEQDHAERMRREEEAEMAIIQQSIEQKKNFEALKQALTDEVDEEIARLRHEYEVRLSAELANTQRAQNSNIGSKTQMTSSKEELNRELNELRELKTHNAQLEQELESLTKDYEINQKEIRERHMTARDKQARIIQLRRKKQELEKFKFVLDYKVLELLQQLAPRKKESAQLKQQIAQMQREVASYDRQSEQLDLEVRRLALKERGLQAALEEAKNDRALMLARLRAFQADIQEIGKLDRPLRAIKAEVRSLYRRHVLAFAPQPGKTLVFRDERPSGVGPWAASALPTGYSALVGASHTGALALRNANANATDPAGVAAKSKAKFMTSTSFFMRPKSHPALLAAALMGSAGSADDGHADYQRQRAYLERSLDSLNEKFKKSASVHRNEATRILQENVALIQEFNLLRRELKNARAQQQRGVLGKVSEGGFGGDEDENMDENPEDLTVTIASDGSTATISAAAAAKRRRHRTAKGTGTSTASGSPSEGASAGQSASHVQKLLQEIEAQQEQIRALKNHLMVLDAQAAQLQNTQQGGTGAPSSANTISAGSSH